MPIGFPGGGMFSRSGGGSGFGQLLGLGGGEPSLDYEQVNALLQGFGGLQIPREIHPQGLFENLPWLSKRSPALASGLDNALIALGNMGPTGSTAGENISNVARGLSAIRPTRQAQAAGQIMLPLQMAGEVSKLQAQKGYMDYLSAMGKYYGGRNEAAIARAQAQAQASVMGKQLAAAKEPVLMKDGTVGIPQWDDETGAVSYVSHPEIDPKTLKKRELSKVLGTSVEGQIIQGILGDDPDSYRRKDARGKVVATGPQAYWQDANVLYLGHKTAGAAVSAGGARDRQTTGEWYNTQRDVFKGIFSGPGTAAIREKRIAQRAQELFMGNQGISYEAATKQAQQEAQGHQSRLLSLQGEFSQLSENEQRAIGGISGFLGSKGYDPNTDSFSSPQGGEKPVSFGDPIIDSIIQGLRKRR